MRKFRLLLMMSSLLALVCSFTACNTDIADDYPAVEISLTAGEADGNTLSFTVKATGADDIYYWVEVVDPEVEAAPELDIEKASYLDAQVDVELKQDVTVSKLKYTTEYKIYAYAKNFAHNAYANTITMTTGQAAVVIPAPEVSVKADEDEIYEDAFLMWVTTKNATKAAWLAVPKYTEGVNAAKVFADGVALAASDLNKEVAVPVENLTPDTEYDFYAAVENSEGVQAISAVVAVTTAKKSINVVEMQFTELRQTQNLAQLVGLPGLYFMLANEAGDKCTLLMYDISQIDNYPGYMANGMYPALTGSFDTMALPEASCVLADPGYTLFISAAGAEYYPVGDMGADADGNPYGINLMTGMPDKDDNLLEFNMYTVNAATNEPTIIRGQYKGPLGYVSQVATWPFNLTQWGFKAFDATVNGNNVTLISNSINGQFKLNLVTENGNIESAYVVGENVTGGFTSFVEGEEFFELKSGRMEIAKAEGGGANDYVLIISTRGDETIMVGASGAYKIDALEYPITITPAQ